MLYPLAYIQVILECYSENYSFFDYSAALGCIWDHIDENLEHQQ